MNNNDYDHKAQLVRKGRSKTFALWKFVFPFISEDEFIENLKQVCAYEQKDKASSGMALTPDGIAKLSYDYGENGCKVHFTDTKEEWAGTRFRIPCFYDRYADFVGTFLQCFKLDQPSKDNVL